MKNILLALALVACSAPLRASEYRCDATGGVMYQSERVIDLPQDQDRLYVTVIGDPSNEQFQQVTNWFARHPQLKQIANGTHFSVMETNSAMYRGRCEQSKSFAPADPSCCIRVQTKDGTVVYQVSGKNMPLSAEALCNQMNTSCFRRQQATQTSINYHYHFDVPVEKEKKEVIEDVFKASIDIPTWFYCVAGGVSLLIGVGIMFAKEYRKHGNGK